MSFSCPCIIVAKGGFGNYRRVSRRQCVSGQKLTWSPGGGKPVVLEVHGLGIVALIWRKDGCGRGEDRIKMDASNSLNIDPVVRAWLFQMKPIRVCQ